MGVEFYKLSFLSNRFGRASQEIGDIVAEINDLHDSSIAGIYIIYSKVLNHIVVQVFCDWQII